MCQIAFFKLKMIRKHWYRFYQNKLGRKKVAETKLGRKKVEEDHREMLEDIIRNYQLISTLDKVF